MRVACRAEALGAGGCVLDVALMWEVFVDEQAKLLYPVNYLRNYARMQVGGGRKWGVETWTCCVQAHVFCTCTNGRGLMTWCCESQCCDQWCLEDQRTATACSQPTGLPAWPRACVHACAQVRTKLLSMIDVDMLIARGLSDEFEKPDRSVRHRTYVKYTCMRGPAAGVLSLHCMRAHAWMVTERCLHAGRCVRCGAVQGGVV